MMEVGFYLFLLKRTVILRNWYVDSELNNIKFRQIPIWVKFTRLSIGYFSIPIN